MKAKKVSQAMLDGYAMVSGQAFGNFYDAGTDMACAVGCAYIGLGVPKTEAPVPLSVPDDAYLHVNNASIHLFGVFGETISSLNDVFRMSIEDIAGILKAEGL